MRPTSGMLVVAGHDVTGASAAGLARAGLCTIPEGRGIFPNLTVRENLLMATYEGHTPLADIEERTYSRFPRLSERRTQLAGTMSGGEQQMLALARGLATDPAILLLDELSMGLAPKIVGQLYEQSRRSPPRACRCSWSNSSPARCSVWRTGRVVMAHGTIRHSGPADELDEQVLATTYLGNG